MAAMKQCEMDTQVEQWGQVECKLSKLSPTLHEKRFCKHLIGSVNVATAYGDDLMRQWRSTRHMYLHWIGIQRFVWKTVKEIDNWFTNGKGYFGHDDSASDVKMV
jgi:hypothetical protein